jgi:pilus assembly protein CpaE
MGVLGVIGAKGGVGTSLVAVSLGLMMVPEWSCVLIDASPIIGVDDLLLDRTSDSDWADLLPVASELTQRHLDLAAPKHPTRLRLLAAPAVPRAADLAKLACALADRVDLVIVDGDAGLSSANRAWIPAVDVLAMVTTLDPTALRATRRIVDLIPHDRNGIGLIINQWTRGHPADPASLASSLGLPLLGVLPLDPGAAFECVNFGLRKSEIGVNGFPVAMIGLAQQVGAFLPSRGDRQRRARTDAGQ